MTLSCRASLFAHFAALALIAVGLVFWDRAGAAPFTDAVFSFCF